MTPRQQSILIGAIVIGALSTSYLSYINNLCCLGIIVGGVVAAQQHASQTQTSAGAADGALLGMFAGIGGAVLGLLFNLALRPFAIDLFSLTQRSVQQTMQQMPSGGAMMEGMVEMMRNPGPVFFGGVLLVRIVTNSIFGAIGGAIGAAIFGGQEESNGSGGVQTAEAEIIDDPDDPSASQSKSEGSS